MFSFFFGEPVQDGILNNFPHFTKLSSKNIWLFQYFFVSLHR